MSRTVKAAKLDGVVDGAKVGVPVIVTDLATAGRLIAQGWPHQELAPGRYRFPSWVRAQLQRAVLLMAVDLAEGKRDSITSKKYLPKHYRVKR